MASGYAVGIDLGTSNTVAIVRWPDGRTRPVLFDGQPVLPSAVFLDQDGTLRVGRDAQRMAQLDPARYEPNPKRSIDDDALFLGDRELPIVDVLAAPLRAVARAVTDTVGHLPPAVITCPVAWGSARKGRLQQAASRAGWPPVTVVPEPIAAARYFTETLRRPIPPGSTLAIFDFGGGTLDVALVRNDGATFTVVGTGGAEDLGGLDIDAAIVAHLGQLLAVQHPQVWAQISQPTDELARRNRRMFWDDVRAAKEMLSRSNNAPIPVPGVSASLHLTRDELEQLATPLLRRATGELTRALRQANLTPAQLSGIFLVGGTSRVPLLSRILHAENNVAPTVLEQPELPVAEGAVAGGVAAASTPTQAPVSASPAVPVSGTPVSGLPVSGTPISGSPSSGMPSSGMPSSGMPSGMPTQVPPRPVPRPYTNVGPPPPRPMPAGPMWVTTGPPPRPPRRYRAWPWLLTIALVVGGLCYGGYLVYQAQTVEPFAKEHTITIADLAPTGLHQMVVTASTAYAIGQHTDGSVEVSTVNLATEAKHSYRSAPAGGWTVAVQLGDWVAVVSVPAADGSRQMFVANPVTDESATATLGNGELVTLQGTKGGGGTALEYVTHSAAANTARYGTVDSKSNVPGTPIGLPGGSRPLYSENGTFFIDGAGKVYRFSSAGLQATQAKVPPGHPTTLIEYDYDRSALLLAESKLGYQVLRSGSPIYQGPTDRQPVWMGFCGADDDVCVIDESPNSPVSREFVQIETGSEQRTPVPYAAVSYRVPGLSYGTDNFMIVPALQQDKFSSIVVEPTRGLNHIYDSEVLLLADDLNGGDIDALMLPTHPFGAAADWDAIPQSLTVTGLDLDGDNRKTLGQVTIRRASCDVAASRLACATATDFQVWKIGRG
ncbi:Hsp70 family protein [Virgisporangium aurantiacum]|uniref:Hsp70 protein n=1 Tax=Virgisporangium aurantiacum TaxID=175570 RepID=A0A8J3Z651_9ACTN|nr:Hsp70 family protein [Virgisporangium aurantiacum]GIJ57662.1 hypothetical protein Vau01_051780 [Virgisporangium aurantiacum]